MRNMKRIGLALFMAMMLALSFGCSKQKVASTPEPAGTTAEQSAVESASSGMTAEQELADALSKGRMTITDSKVYFDFDKFDIKADYREPLKGAAAVMKKFPQLRVLVEGHCDARGTEEYNLALGERRARTVKEYLMVLGVSAAQIEVVSFGEERPAVEGTGEAVWSKNRRAEFKIIK